MSILVTRHAETEQGAARIVQVPSAQLSALGRSQAELLARRVGQLGVGRILSSDLARAVETAEIIAKHISVSVDRDPLLRERDFGELRGTSYSGLTFDPFAIDYVPPKGEGWPVFFERVALAWKSIVEAAARTPGRLLVITHGLVCQVLSERHWQPSDVEASTQSWTHTALTEVESMPPWKVVRMNCAVHLAAHDALQPTPSRFAPGPG